MHEKEYLNKWTQSFFSGVTNWLDIQHRR